MNLRLKKLYRKNLWLYQDHIISEKTYLKNIEKLDLYLGDD